MWQTIVVCAELTCHVGSCFCFLTYFSSGIFEVFAPIFESHLMASMTQIAFWHAMSKRRTWNATSFDRFLSAVDNNPESFELFIQYLRDADDGKQAQHVHSHSEVADLKASSLTRPKRKECERHLISLWHAPLKRSNQLNELWAL